MYIIRKEIHGIKHEQFGTVDVTVPWAFLQEQHAGLAGKEETMSI